MDELTFLGGEPQQTFTLWERQLQEDLLGKGVVDLSQCCHPSLYPPTSGKTSLAV